MDLRVGFGYMTIEKGGKRGLFSFLMYLRTGNFSHDYMGGTTDITFYSDELSMDDIYMDVSRSSCWCGVEIK
jgi:hypothetical protein